MEKIAVYGILLSTLLVHHGNAQVELHILFTGDIHGYIQSDDPSSHGDLLRIKRAIQNFKSYFPDRSYLLLDTGDALAYHYLSIVDSGKTIWDNMMDVGFEGMVPGNLDFTYGGDNLLKLNKMSGRLQMIASNLFTAQGAYFAAPYKIIRSANLDIGIVGIVDPNIKITVASERLKGLVVIPPVEALKKVLGEIRPQCDLIIGISHMKTLENLDMSKQIDGLDIIIGTPDESDNRNFIKLYSQGQLKSSLVKAYVNALSIGRLTVVLEEEDDNYHVIDTILNNPIEISKIPASALETDVNRDLEEKYIQYSVDKYKFHPDGKLAFIDEKFTKSEFIQYVLYAILKSTRSEIAMVNDGLFRFDNVTFGDYLTLRDVEKILWYNDQIVIFRLTGKEIKAIEKKSKSNGRGSSSRIHFLSVQNYGAKRTSELTIHGKSISDQEVYAVAANNYLADGGDGYHAEFRNKIFTKTKFIGGKRIVADEHGEPVFIKELLLKYFLSLDDKPDFSNFEGWLNRSEFLNRPLWRIRIDHFDFGYKSISVANNKDFKYARDSRIKSSTLGSTNLMAFGDANIIREAQKSRWENGALFKYEKSRINKSSETVVTNVEFESILDMYLFSFGGKINPFASLLYDTDYNFEQRDLFGKIGASWVGSQKSFLRFGAVGKRDLVEGNFNLGAELTTRYIWDVFSIAVDSNLRARYLASNSEAKPGDELASVEFNNGFSISLTNHLKLRPALDIFLYRDKVVKKIASHVLFSLYLAYSRDWKFQYQKFFRGEGN